MKDNEIIKALECCIDGYCRGCMYGETSQMTCRDDLMRESLDLINRQKSEIDILIRKKETLRDEIAEQQAEIERLKEFIEKDQGLILKLTGVPVEEYNQKVKSEAIKEFADKYVTELVDTYDLKWIQIDNLKKIADKVLNEMTEQ